VDNVKSEMIEKVRKLLALAADPGCVGAEAENATRMATRLMVKYQIDESLLAQSGASFIKVGFGYARHMVKGEIKAPTFAGVIAIGVGDFLGCVTSLVWIKEAGAEQQVQRFKFAGEVADVKFAVWLCETMCAQALREWVRAKTESRKDAWLNGFAAAVQFRLRDMTKVKKEEEEEIKKSSGTAVLVLDGKVALVKEKFGDTSREPTKAKTAADGFQAGMKAVIPTGALGSNAPTHQLGF